MIETEAVDWTRYWFMFPTAMGVASVAMLSGIGGAALFVPIFLIVFPLLGPEYPLTGPAIAIGAAVMTEMFGFSSGLIGYLHKRLVHLPTALPFLAISVPVGIAGALVLPHAPEQVLQAAYAVLMLVLAPVILRRRPSRMARAVQPDRPLHEVTARNRVTYRFAKVVHGWGAIWTGIGAFLTGLLGVGVGEVVMPQLVKRNAVPIPVAAATSVCIVVVTVVAASFTQISVLVRAGGFSVVPWHLVCYTIPGVLIGGQIGPRLQGRIPQRRLELGMAGLFVVIGLAMGWIALNA